MSDDNFEKALQFVLKSEGGYSNDRYNKQGGSLMFPLKNDTQSFFRQSVRSTSMNS